VITSLANKLLNHLFERDIRPQAQNDKGQPRPDCSSKDHSNRSCDILVAVPILYRPMRLLRIPEPFDHPDFVFEPKIDGFRALAYVSGHRCELMSRNGHVFKSSPQLAEEIAHAVRANRVMLDGRLTPELSRANESNKGRRAERGAISRSFVGFNDR
jgi:ATP-dependent DNA ligase